MAARLLVVVAVAHAAYAYSNTSPLVAWSSSGSLALESLPSRLDPTVHSTSLIESILDGEDICGHDAVILIAQPGLHASDLRRLSPTMDMSRSLRSAPSARQYPYIPSSAVLDIANLGEQLAAKCGSRMVDYPVGVGADEHLQHGKKHVVCISMPHLSETGRSRKEAMSNHESLISYEVSSLASTFPNHLVIYTGSTPSSLGHGHSHNHNKRQSNPSPDRPVLDLSSFSDDDDLIDDFKELQFLDDESPSSTSTLGAPSPTATTTATPAPPKGGILKRYQILTPALITGLLVAFFLLVPVLYFALSALASIQIPIRSDVGKTFNAVEKKNQ